MFIYLATPYSHPDPDRRILRYQAAEQISKDIALRRIAVYCPIVHWHFAAVNHELPTDHEFWEAQNHPFMIACDEAWFVKLDGWEQSRGMTAEAQFCRGLNVPMKWFNLEELYGHLQTYCSSPRTRASQVSNSGRSPRTE